MIVLTSEMIMSTCLTGSSMSSSLPLMRVISGLVSLMHTCLTLTVVEAVGINDLLGLVENVGHVDTDNLLGTSLRGKHGEDTGTAADIENDLVLEQVLVLDDGIAVRHGADLILKHLLVDAEVRVRVGVAVGVSVLSTYAAQPPPPSPSSFIK